jgi:hypothetical protein
MAREAVELVEATDLVDLQAEAFMARAEVLDMSGRSGERATCLEEALRVYEARENLVGAEQARALIAQSF